MQPKPTHPQFEEPFTDAGQFRYRIKSLGASSAKFGPCEVCAKHVADVLLQTEGTCYLEDDGTLQTTYYGCRDLFGHEACLRSARR